MPNLDQEALQRLRRLVLTLQGQERGSVPYAELVRLARDCDFDGGVTLDFVASRELGQPMVVLRPHRPPEPAPVLDVLSRRERQVAALVTDGLSNKQIGRSLFIALPTVKDHVHRILAKTSLPNRAALAAAFKGHTSVGPDAVGSSQHTRGRSR